MEPWEATWEGETLEKGIELMVFIIYFKTTSLLSNIQMKSESSMTDAYLEEVARLFATLAEPSRLKLLRALMEGDKTVTELVEATGMKQGNVSKHLGVLTLARFLSRNRDGNFVRYSIADPRLAPLCHLMCDRVEADIQQRVRELAPVGGVPVDPRT